MSPSRFSVQISALIWAIIPCTDQDTDRYVLEVLAPELRTSLRDHKKDTQWTDNVYVLLHPRRERRSRRTLLRSPYLLLTSSAMHLVKLHEKGATKQQIIDTLQGMPVVRHSTSCELAYASVDGPDVLLALNAGSTLP